jgi:hypothetical protein
VIHVPPLRIYLIWSALLSITACKGDRTPESVALETSSVAHVHYSLRDLELAPRLRSEPVADGAFGRSVNDSLPGIEAPNTIVALPNGSMVIQHDWFDVEVFRGLERLRTVEVPDTTRTHRVIGISDTFVFASRGRTLMVPVSSGAPPVPFAEAQDLIGALSDGTLIKVVRSSRTPRNAGFRTVSTDVFVEAWRLNVQSTEFRRHRTLPLHAEQVSLMTFLPWFAFPLAAIGSGTLWISQVSDAELLRLSSDLKPELRVTWDDADSLLAPAEQAVLRNQQFRNRNHPDFDSAAVEKVLAESGHARAIDRLLAGPDGSVWVRKRLPWTEPLPDSVSWYGFSGDGALIGHIQFPHTTTVYVLSATEAIVSSAGSAFEVERRRIDAHPRHIPPER